MNDSRSGTVGAPSTSGINFRLTPPPEAVSFSSCAMVCCPESGAPTASPPATAAASLSVPRRESPAGTGVPISPFLAALRQGELEDRPHDVLPGCWRAGTGRGHRSFCCAWPVELLERPQGTRKSPGSPLHGADKGGRIVTNLVDETHDRPVIQQVLDRGEAMVGNVGGIGGRGPGAKAVVHPDLRAIDIIDGVDRPVDVEVIAPLRRPTARQGDGDRVGRGEDDLEV